MSALKTTADQPALPGRPIAHDQARALLGQVMASSPSPSDSPRSAPTWAAV
jgi:hypothetical protein